MKGLELSKKYYDEICAPLIHDKFPDYERRIAAGLAGEGSQCFGYDDELSRDHDWGAAICLWLTKDDYQAIGNDLKQELRALPRTFYGYPCDHAATFGQDSTGVMTIDDFYRKFITVSGIPQTLEQWRQIGSNSLAMATNGKVFRDDLGEFSHIRQELRKGYPADVRKKKLAYYCLLAAHSGQYNLPRIVQRNDNVAAQLTLTEFIHSSLNIIFLLNNAYAPYYKWIYRSLTELTILGKELAPLYHTLCISGTWTDKLQLVETICQNLINELQSQRLSTSNSDFLLEHGHSVREQIADQSLRRMNPWLE